MGLPFELDHHGIGSWDAVTAFGRLALEQQAKLRLGVQILATDDRDTRPPADRGHVVQVLCGRRLFIPEAAVLLEYTRKP